MIVYASKRLKLMLGISRGFADLRLTVPNYPQSFFSWLQCFVSRIAFAVYPWNYRGKLVGPPNIKVSRSSTETGDFRRAGAGRRVVA
jgi:hypothetical protein